MSGRHDIPMGLRAAYRLMHRQTNLVLSEFGVTADQFVLLTLLEGDDGLIQQDLVHRASSDPNTIRAMLLLLEERNLVRRTSHPLDRRAVRVTMTSEGKRIYTQLTRQIRPLQDQIYGLFSEDEAERLVELLGRLVRGMKASKGKEPSAETRLSANRRPDRSKTAGHRGPHF